MAFRSATLLRQAIDDFLTVCVCDSFYSTFVKCEQNAVEHDNATVYDDGTHIGGFCGVYEMRVDAVHRRLVKAVETYDRDIGAFTDLY